MKPALFALLLVALPAMAAPPIVGHGDPRLSGMAKLDCSGAVVRLSPAPDAPAVVLTAGHCLGVIAPGRAYVNLPVQRAISLYSRTGAIYGLTSARVIYGTMTGTDIALLELPISQGALAALQIDGFPIANAPAAPGDPIALPSGQFNTLQICAIDGLVPLLREDQWQFRGAYKYHGCYGAPGTSGSPLISLRTGAVVGVNSTNNSATGIPCSFDNPCEINLQGQVVSIPGMTYGEHVEAINGCVDVTGRFDLSLPGCTLFR